METFELEGKTYLYVQQVGDKKVYCEGCVFEENSRLCAEAPNGCTTDGIIYKEKE